MSNALAYDGAMAAILVQDPFFSGLIVSDRCDRCGAQAYVRVGGESWPQDLLFCAHHGRMHVPVLSQDSTVRVHDESDKLTAAVVAQKLATDAV